MNSSEKAIKAIALPLYRFYTRVKCAIRGLRFVPPNYAFFDNFTIGATGIDVGVGEHPDFTTFLIKNYSMKCYIIDPTLRHRPKLEKFAKENSGVSFFPFALGSKTESRTFYESQTNVSGSLQKEHINVQNDPVETYEVQVVTLGDLLRRIDAGQINIMKIDIEGEEYDFVKSISKEDLEQINQIIIEFHHGKTLKKYSMADTRRVIETIEDFGMKSIMYNEHQQDHACLFYWEKKPKAKHSGT
jgi:FkbM family methyltransferase